MSAVHALRGVVVEQRRFMSKVYGWMFLALLVTAWVAYYTASSEALLNWIFGNEAVFFGLLIGQLLIVLALSWGIEKLSAGVATLSFFIYAILNGLTLSCIFLLYTEASIAMTFFITAGTFGIMGAYGYFTKRDLTTVGNLCLMGLIGIILSSIVNLVYYNALLYDITSYVGVLVFVGLTAYDTQRIKKFNERRNEGSAEDHKGAIMGALTLYLDFINLFLNLLKILGKIKR